MKRQTRSYNLRSVAARQAQREGARSEVPSAVTQRVCKKIAKTIYQTGKSSRISSRVCLQAAEKIEELILENSSSFEEYKARIIASVERLGSDGSVVGELSERAGNGEFEDWIREFVLVSIQ